MGKKVLPRSPHLLNTRAHVHLDAHTHIPSRRRIRLALQRQILGHENFTDCTRGKLRGFYRIREKQNRVGSNEPYVSPLADQYIKRQDD